MLNSHFTIADAFKDWCELERDRATLEAMLASDEAEIAAGAKRFIAEGRHAQHLMAFNSIHQPVVAAEDIWRLIIMTNPAPISLHDDASRLAARARYRFGLPLPPDVERWAKKVEAERHEFLQDGSDKTVEEPKGLT